MEKEKLIGHGLGKFVERIPVEELREIFDHTEGKLFYKPRPRNHFTSKAAHSAWRRFIGRRAGCPHPQRNTSYEQVKVTHKGKIFRLLSHIIIWTLETGEYPEEVIDHIDGDGLNNIISNLRSTSQSENIKNRIVR